MCTASADNSADNNEWELSAIFWKDREARHGIGPVQALQDNGLMQGPYVARSVICFADEYAQ